jgi:subtilase family serine protease
MELNYIVLALKPTAAQQADLDQLLAEQQDPASPNFRKWLTPEQYADRFGASSSDIAQIVAWLQSQGLTVISTARGRNFVAFKGTAGQVEAALHVEIHNFLVDGESHYANATEPSVPAAILPFTIGFIGLDDFKPKPPMVKPVANFTSSNGQHSLAPGDLYTIYNLTPLYGLGIDGAGMKLAVIGQSDVNLSDINSFRSEWGLAVNPPVKVLVPGSTDPGVLADDGEESDLDLEWSGAIARNAEILFIYSTDVVTSAQYAIDQAVAPVISYSYTKCEPGASSSGAGVFQPLAQQANAQGITWLASSGDAGAAGCDRQNGNPVAQNGIAVNLPASVPEVTGVGGTEFTEGVVSYWSSSNGAYGGSALSYIPEIGWNDSGSGGLASSGGGMSIFFARPAWQSAPGVQSLNVRFVPDLSLTASADHDGYNVFIAGSATIVGGTSASTPVFAGMILLMNQYLGVNGVGNINPNLYRLASSTTNVFHDITSGTNIVPCVAGSNGCQSNGTLGYAAGPGYDMVTGLSTRST